jgi:YaiO family outer membrane protein
MNRFKRGRSPLKVTVRFVKGTVPFIFAGLLMASTVFACDATLEATVAAKPDDTDSRDALARSCARAGRPSDALAQYDILLAHDANNVDWLVGKSQALIALRGPREALPYLEKGRALSPAYEDIWRLNYSALDQLDEFDAADALLTQAAVQFPQATWPLERKAALDERRLLERGNRLSADVSYEDLSGGRDPWKGASIGLDHRLGASRHLFAGLHFEERFDARDEQLLFGYADRLNDDWSYGVSADLSPDAVNLPRWSFTAEAGRRLPDAWSLGFRFRHASHANTDVDSLSASVEKYFDWLSLGYSLNTAKVSDISDPHFGHVLRAAHEYGEASRVALVVGFGEEAETVAPGVIQVTDTQSISLAGLHWTSTAWGFSWEAGWYEQGDLYDRIRLRVGVEHRF